MSDEDIDMYEDEEVQEEGGEEGVELETKYYDAKGLMEEDVSGAIEGFEEVVTLDTEKGEWGFKALKKLVQLYFQKSDLKKALAKFKPFMESTKNVANNVSEKAINSVLDAVGTAKDQKFLDEVYSVALLGLKGNGNERVWFRTCHKYGKLLFDLNEHGKLEKVLQDLHKSCQTPTGEDDIKKGSQLVDIYALEIQMYTATKNNKKLKELYNKAMEMVKVSIPLPRIMGIIRECGGKMHMREKEWDKAYTDFFEAFKAYDEAGVSRRIQCLKYLVLANMLNMGDGGMSTNVFDSPEAKPYKNDPEVVAMTSLISAHESKDIRAFEKILKDNKKTISDDPFMKDYIDDLLKNIRTAVLLKIMKPYTQIRISFLATELNISPKDVEELAIGLILDDKIQGKIDQISGYLLLNTEKSADFFKYQAVTRWAKQLSSLHTTVIHKLN